MPLSFAKLLLGRGSLPYGMFDVAHSDAEARRARRMESIYHVGQTLGLAFRKQADIDAAIKAEFPLWPEDPPVRRVFEGLCEVLFPSEGSNAKVPMTARIRHGLEVVTRARKSVVEQWGVHGEKIRPANAA